MRAMSFLSLVVLMCGIASAVEQGDSGVQAQTASLRRMRYRSAPSQATPTDKGATTGKTPADKSATADKGAADKKADASTPSANETEKTIRRRGLFRRRYVARKSQTSAAPLATATNEAPTFRMVSDQTPAASDAPATPAPDVKKSVKTKRRLFARRRARRGK